MSWIKKALGISDTNRDIDEEDEDVPLDTRLELQMSLERMERSIKRAQDLFQRLQREQFEP